MSRTFQVQPGRTVTLPQGLQAGAGATNMRLSEGCDITFDDEVCEGMYSRFINGRKNAGDWKELTPAEVASLPKDRRQPELVPDPNKPMTGRGYIETGAPPKKKEG